MIALREDTARHEKKDEAEKRFEDNLKQIREKSASNYLTPEFIERVKAYIQNKYPNIKPTDLLKE